ncbi:uncharacterized protein I303_108246 [Kwoniella dejecticola CBS 10117]|uniref:PUM-HD domain-containing protein n=1 Tax=Kwoniella dejecticola CBS 10117 TaxID=1296121 RepID=A0A1A5ZXX6_9TREE|nr:uncharacterized protein I303_07427 [Kwoniella dejecticola CBS 10117]OBR82664.1 hypothetical protein I303_07427 [Kwoniella dejecticola CBS 10117]
MTFQPFASSTWAPPNPNAHSRSTSNTGPANASRHTTPGHTPPSEGPSPIVATPNSSMEESVWSDRFQMLPTSHIGPIISDPKPTGPEYKEQRRVLGDLPTHANQVSPHALASPFMPGINNGAWGPPVPLKHRPPPPQIQTHRKVSLEEQLAIAEERIRELTFENQKLKERNANAFATNTPAHTSPPVSSRSSMIFDSGYPSFSSAGYGQIAGLGLQRFEDPEVCYDPSRLSQYLNDHFDKASYSPPSHLFGRILQGTFKFADMPHEYIRPIVWIIAHRIPKSSSERSGLKAAVNALASRLGLPRALDPTCMLVRSIIEWAKPLCFTSCGNYLCQQLLERGDTQDKEAFIREIQDDIVPIASDKFGTHVLCKAIMNKELEQPISDALIKFGIFDSMRTGARRIWREYLEKCRQARQSEIFTKINAEMVGRWAELACINEHGSIAVQQVFEVFGSQDLMEPAFKEILDDIAKVANNQFGHFAITKLIGYPQVYRRTCEAILTSYPPVAVTHHGVNFAKIALTEGGRGSIMKYVNAICSFDDGRTPGIVAIATSSIGKAHLTFVLSCLTPAEHIRVRQTCRAYSTTLRNSQSGNDLLRSLGLMHAVGVRHRAGSG